MDDYSQYAGLIFDCDGTLTDSMPLHYEAWLEALSPCGISFSKEKFYSMGGMRSEKIVEVLAAEQSIEADPDQVTAVKEAAFARRIPNIEAREDICQLAKKYHGSIPISVASGGDKEGIKAQLQQIDMLKYFEVIVTAEDTAKHKPEPDVFLKTAELLGVPASGCLVFEDSPLGLEAARRASMDCIDVRDGSFHRAS
ncbi:HAD family hydrolase [Novipirellula artificiosorum]|uniref:Fructose-1-phosphate phosphatase YqaB n=1 Tax=Novipirellula artificiosorum TaxID=2528016 RepID=A0A5C6E3W9_9BACT|nr:HAD-IA family hydrolase [Novipirellula artificiosorum]TWU42136.1 Fructose-1-phosphate phosphatase YqaB [Novipirellula artificiosorum]